MKKKKKTKELISNALCLLATSLIWTSIFVGALMK